MVFDAVYRVKKTVKERANITHALLDFWDEDYELAEYCEQNLIFITADKVTHRFCSLKKMDLRELFVVDNNYYKGTKSPLIFRMLHARLRQPGCNLFETCF